MTSTPPSELVQHAVGHPGSSSSDRRPAAAPRGGGLSEWPDHSGLRGATRGRRVASSAAGRREPPGKVRQPVQPQVRINAVAVSLGGQHHSRLRGATRRRRMASEDPAGGGTDSARPRSLGITVAASGNDWQCPAGRGQEAHRLTKVTPKGCTPRKRPPAELSEISIPRRVSGGAHLHLYSLRPGLSSKFTELRHAHSCCLLTCLISQPFRTCPLLHPCHTLPPRYLPGWQISGSLQLESGLFGPAISKPTYHYNTIITF
jgi:hypothetical protein